MAIHLIVINFENSWTAVQFGAGPLNKLDKKYKNS